MTKTNIDVAQALASLADAQKMMLEALQSVTSRIDALEQASSAPAKKDAEKTAPANPKKNWPDWALLPGVVPDGYTPLHGVTVSEGYIQGYGFSYKKSGDNTYIVMKGFSFSAFTSKEGKTFPAGARGKTIRLTLEQFTALFHALKASLEMLYGAGGIPSASVSMTPAPAEESDNVDPENFTCPLCGQTGFKTKGGIRRHYSTKHKGLDCPVS